MKYRDSFYKHGCTETIADYVIDFGLWYELHDSDRGNNQVMYVGWDELGNQLWEIGIELCSENEDDWAFHAQLASKKSKDMVGL